MTIKQRIQLNTLVLLVFIGVIGAIFFISNVMVQRAENGASKISAVAGATTRLYGLTQDYVTSPSAESQSAWQVQYAVVTQILNDPGLAIYEKYPAFQELRINSNTIKSLFSQITQAPSDIQVRNRFESQILSHTRIFSDESTKLSLAIFSESDLVRQRSILVLFILFELLFAVAVSLAFFINRTVSLPIMRLTDAVKHIETGDISVQAPVFNAQDEIGVLGSSFNKMMTRLNDRTQALEKEKTKDEALVGTLDERVLELEDSRKAMANLLQDFEQEHKALTEAKAKDDALLENIGDGMIAVDMDQKIIVVNKMAEDLLGVNREEVLGQPYEKVLQLKDVKDKFVPLAQRPLSLVLVSGERYTSPAPVPSVTPAGATSHLPVAPIYYMRKDGTKFPVALTVSPIIVDGEIVGAIDIFRDITKEQEIEKLRIDFLALASHQLRTPLSGTKWLIETIRRGVTGETTVKQKEYLDQIYGANERMIALVYDMLDVLKLESNIMVVSRQDIVVSTLFEGVMDKMSTDAKKREVTLRSELDKDSKLTVLSDFDAVRLCMECFVSNAIHYSTQGKEVILGTKEEESSVTLFVKDHGIGIPKEEEGRIFERFYRASNAKQFIPEGTGLGLYRAVLLADKIGAKISFNSEEGKGTTFNLQLPKDVA